jgi:hypothetical protein
MFGGIFPIKTFCPASVTPNAKKLKNGRPETKTTLVRIFIAPAFSGNDMPEDSRFRESGACIVGNPYMTRFWSC